MNTASSKPDSDVTPSKLPDTDGDENDDENLVGEDKVQVEEPTQAPPPPAIEKVPEEDKRRPHPVKRALYKMFPFLEKSTFKILIPAWTV